MKRIFKKLASILLMLISGSTFAHTKLETVGDVAQIALPVAALEITFIHNDTKGIAEFAYSYLLSTGTVQLLKHTIHRVRPNNGPQSFPSGHTANGFVAASFLQFRYGLAYGIPAFAVAGVIGYTRLQTNKHWPSDVLVGAAIGVGSSFIFTTKYKKPVEIVPYYNPENKESGITMSARIS